MHIQYDYHNKSRNQKLEQYINQIQIKIPKFSKHHLYSLALNNYNQYILHINQLSKLKSRRKINKKFLNRITVNYIRHQLTNYDQETKKLFKSDNEIDQYILLKNKINNEIYKTYPFLKN